MIKMSLYLPLLAMAIIGLTTSVYSAQVSAADDDQKRPSESILLTPTSKRYELNAGATKTDSFKIVNDGSSKLTFIVYARPYAVEGEDYKSNYESDSSNADAYKWVQYEKASFELEPGQSTDVKYTIRVPADAAPGGHYGVLFAETQASGTVNGTTIAQKKRVGAILYAQVNGEVTTSGSFLGSKTPLFQFKAPIEVRQRVKNGGNTDFTVRSGVEVSDLFGGLKYKNDKDAVIFPGTTRAIVNDWVNPAWIGLYKVEQTAVFLDTNRSTVNYVIFVPLWVYITLGLLIGGRILYALAQHKRKA